MNLHFLTALFLFITCFSFAQESSNGNKIVIVHTDKLSVKKSGQEKELLGNIQLKHLETYFYAHRALITDKRVTATGNIMITQGDTISIVADSLFYNSTTKEAQLRGNVLLRDKTTTLSTDILNYDTKTRVASYFNNATIQDSTATLTSKQGFYYANEKLAHFKDSVVVKGEDFYLESDTLQHSIALKTSYFFGPTNFQSEKNKIYCEGGSFNHALKKSILHTNAILEDDERKAKADTVKYDGVKDFIELDYNTLYQQPKDSFEITGDYMSYDRINDFYTVKGKSKITKGTYTIQSDDSKYDGNRKELLFTENVVINNSNHFVFADSVYFNQEQEYAEAFNNIEAIDTLNKLHLKCERLEYNNIGKSIKAYEKSYAYQISNADTLYLGADTLYTYEDTSDLKGRNIIADNNVKIFKSDIQGICDSLGYTAIDSTLSLMGNPFVWAEGSQFSAEKIDALFSKNKIKSVHLQKKGYIINTMDSLFYNQIKGKSVTAHIVDKNLDNVEVLGNGESLTFVQDDDNHYIGYNKTKCGKMDIRFTAKELKDIYFYLSPEASFLPMPKKATAGETKLKGFFWNLSNRPNSKNAIIKK